MLTPNVSLFTCRLSAVAIPNSFEYMCRSFMALSVQSTPLIFIVVISSRDKSGELNISGTSAVQIPIISTSLINTAGQRMPCRDRAFPWCSIILNKQKKITVRYKMVNSSLKLCSNAICFILQDFVVERETGLGNSFRRREKLNNLSY